MGSKQDLRLAGWGSAWWKGEGVEIGLTVAQKVQECVESPGPLAVEGRYHRTAKAGRAATCLQFRLSSLQGLVNIVFRGE